MHACNGRRDETSKNMKLLASELKEEKVVSNFTGKKKDILQVVEGDMIASSFHSPDDSCRFIILNCSTASYTPLFSAGGCLKISY